MKDVPNNGGQCGGVVECEGNTQKAGQDHCIHQVHRDPGNRVGPRNPQDQTRHEIAGPKRDDQRVYPEIERKECVDGTNRTACRNRDQNGRPNLDPRLDVEDGNQHRTQAHRRGDRQVEVACHQRDHQGQRQHHDHRVRSQHGCIGIPGKHLFGTKGA